MILYDTALVSAASSRKHRPASHPVYAGLPRYDTEPAYEPTHELSGWRIRSLRLQRGMSQYDLARAMGVSRPAVAQWELGRSRPTADHVERLRRVLR